jgi:hypothetical protein
MRFPRFAAWLLGAIALFLAAGCGRSDGVKTVSVSGTIYLDGKPVEGLEVHFLGKDFAGFGTTGADGTYRLIRGTTPGENRVYFRKYVIPPGAASAASELDSGQLEAMAQAAGPSRKPRQKQPSQLLPEQYSDPVKSKITFNVPEAGSQKADFKLTSKPK